jgi:integrase
VSSGCQKPEKPYPDFPLFAHAIGRWAKKIRGRLVYFGPWTNPDAALAKYLDEKNALHAGRTPRADAGELTVKTLVNAFLNHKQARVDSGELSRRTWADYKATTDLIVERFGRNRLVEDLDALDFERLRVVIIKRWGIHRAAKLIQCTRSVFRIGAEEGMIEKAVRFGAKFRRASKKTFRLAKAAQEVKLFTVAEITRMLAAATPSMRAMILLGINCGFGNADCATLPIRALNLDAGWINFPRPKTGLDRRCPLWPETVKALRDWLKVRPDPKGDTDPGLVFITAVGGTWMKDTSDNPVSKEMAKLLKKLGIDSHRNFYTRTAPSPTRHATSGPATSSWATPMRPCPPSTSSESATTG